MDHISEDELDRYAARQLPEAQATVVEDHLLTCSFCQERLRVTDEFIVALREVVWLRAHRAAKARKSGSPG